MGCPQIQENMARNRREKKTGESQVGRQRKKEELEGRYKGRTSECQGLG
jgi:hypothetical protein